MNPRAVTDTVSYKDTVNLPQTDFSMRANAVVREPEIQQFWTARDYFGFVTGLMLWIGLFFEFPLVIYILTYMGLV